MKENSAKTTYPLLKLDKFIVLGGIYDTCNRSNKSWVRESKMLSKLTNAKTIYEILKCLACSPDMSHFKLNKTENMLKKKPTSRAA